ncbi:MAG: hypothetical protein WCK78_14635 [Paludibacter sp.]
MKTFKLLVFGLILILTGSVQSQLSVNVHIGSPPAWGPAGYNDVRYYYLPDVEAYYDVQTSMFIYFSGNHWIRRGYLPSHYKNYDLFHGYKVVMRDYRGNSPYSNFREHKMKYAKGYRGSEQHNVGERNQRRDMPQRHSEINQPDNNRNNGNKELKNNRQNQGQENKKAQMPGDNKNNQRGNDKDKKEGHDNGNRK